MTKKGFTLIELMIVVVFIGILAAVVIPKFADLVTNSKISEMGYEASDVKEFIRDTYPETYQKKLSRFVDRERGGELRAEFERYKAFGPSKFKRPFSRTAPKTTGCNCACTR